MWDGQQTPAGTKCHSNFAEKNNRPAPEHANDHIQVAASPRHANPVDAVACAKTDAGWGPSSMMDHIHLIPCHKSSCTVAPPTQICLTEELHKLHSSLRFPVLHPRRNLGRLSEWGGYQRETVGLSAEELIVSCMCLKVIHSVTGFNIGVFLSLDYVLCLRCGFSSST